jgi:predicted transcriptional regulator
VAAVRSSLPESSDTLVSAARVQIAIDESVARGPALEDLRIDIDVSNLYLQDMDALPLKPERLAQLEEFARRRGKSTADALDDALADYLAWECQDYQEALDAVRLGHEDVKAGRTMPADQFLEEFARKHGLPR